MKCEYSIEQNTYTMFNDIYTSKESYSGQYELEMVKAIEDLESIEAIHSLYMNNMNSKIKMLLKINNEYGTINRGIERYCRIQSLEADEVNNSQPSSDNNSNSPEDSKKKTTFVDMTKKVLDMVMNVMKKIFQWIIDMINKLRYNNKVFESTINTINNASSEDLNKVGDDLKNVKFKTENLLEINKHPQDNVNKHIGTYQNICSVFENAVSSAGNNPKDLTRLKDFSIKLVDFVKSIPDVGNSCPKLEGDGAQGLKQYYQSLKTYCNNVLNYKKQPNSFNNYFGGCKTISGEITVSQIIGNTDPKALVNIIKSESDSIGKLSELLNKINASNNKTGKGIGDLLKKFISVGKDGAEPLNAQIQTLITIQKTLAQFNGIFTGICANSIKTINVIKGKLIESVKKNVNRKQTDNNENTQNSSTDNNKSNDNNQNATNTNEENNK